MLTIAADTIDLATFEAALARYQDTLSTVSGLKSKPPQKSLEELDRWKDDLQTVVRKREDSSAGSHLTKAEVEEILRWKLKHGKNRPTLPSLVASNPAKVVVNTTTKAFTAEEPTDEASLKKLLLVLTTPLKGIGPATATAMLAVYFPDSIPFFSDEAYRWVVLDGDWKGKIDYTAKEYVVYWKAVKELRKRLAVDAKKIERVGWVLGQEHALGLSGGEAASTSETKYRTKMKLDEKPISPPPTKSKPIKVTTILAEKTEDITKDVTKDVAKASNPQIPKRKDPETEPLVRRSKRNKTSG